MVSPPSPASMPDGTSQTLRTRLLDSTLGDVRFAIRHAIRKPLTSLTIIAVLSIGIGVHAAVFSAVQALTTRTAPGVPQTDALVRLRGKEQIAVGSKWYPRGYSYTEFRELAEHRELFASSAAWTTQDLSLDLASGEDVGAVDVHFVTNNYFTTLGIAPAAGSGFSSSDRADQSEPEMTAIIGHQLWQTVFGGSTSVIGQTVRLNQTVVRIVGVAPERFNGAIAASGMRTMFVPLSARATIMRSSNESLLSRDTTLFQAFARLNNGVTIEQANATAQVVASRAVAQLKAKEGAGLRESDVVPLRANSSLPVNDDAVMVAAVYGSVALLILLITCTNVSALVVGAATTRRQEIAVRLSLGASRKRIVRQLLTESVVLSTIAGAVGLALFWAIVQYAASSLPEYNLTPDFGTVAFTMLFALGTGVLFGLSPALHATKRGLSETLKDATAGAVSKSRLQRGFVVAQIVFTQPLLAGLAVMLALVMQDGAKRLGDDAAQNIVMLRFNLYNASNPKLDYAKESVKLENALKIVAQNNGYTAVAEPVGIMNTNVFVKAEDRSSLPAASKSVSVHIEATSPGYFALIDVPMLSGRDLTAEDSLSRSMPVVIDSDLATELWGGAANAVGKHFIQTANTRDGKEREIEVVGVYDARYPTTRGAGTRIYAPQTYNFTYSFLLRTNGPARPQLASIRTQIRNELPNTTIARIQTLADVNRENSRHALKLSSAAAAGGVLALLLASIGLYGVVALALGQRRREIGVRIALGARPSQVVQMLFASGVRLSAIGLLLGLPVSMFVVKVLAQQAKLPEMNMALIGAGIGSVVVVVASLATWIPARGAARVDPVRSLKAE